MELLPNPQVDIIFKIPDSYTGSMELDGVKQSLCSSVTFYKLDCGDMPFTYLCLTISLGDLLISYGVSWYMVITCERKLSMPLLLHPEIHSGALPFWGLTASTKTLSENRAPVPTIPEPIHRSPLNCWVSLEPYGNISIFLASLRPLFLSGHIFFL